MKRLLNWLKVRLTEKEARMWFEAGVQEGLKQAQENFGPIMQVHPWQPPHKEIQPIILGIRQRAKLAQFRRLYLVDENTEKKPAISRHKNSHKIP